MESREGLNDLICPLSGQIFLDPVKVPVESLKKTDGSFEKKYITVERQVIERWIAEKGTNPYTRKPLNKAALTPDEEVRKKVCEFLEKNPDRKVSQYTLETSPVAASSHPLRSSEPTEDDLLAMRRAQGIPDDELPRRAGDVTCPVF